MKEVGEGSRRLCADAIMRNLRKCGLYNPCRRANVSMNQQTTASLDGPPCQWSFREKRYAFLKTRFEDELQGLTVSNRGSLAFDSDEINADRGTRMEIQSRAHLPRLRVTTSVNCIPRPFFPGPPWAAIATTTLLSDDPRFLHQERSVLSPLVVDVEQHRVTRCRSVPVHLNSVKHTTLLYPTLSLLHRSAAHKCDGDAAERRRDGRAERKR